jgi:hypothetical protein
MWVNPQRTRQACPERYRGINSQTLRVSAPLREPFFHAEIAEFRRGAEGFWGRNGEKATQETNCRTKTVSFAALERRAENMDRHCEERSDEAIQGCAKLLWIAALRSQ